MSALIWFNEDGINPDHPMINDYPDAPRVYIFDLPYLQKWQISKHRVQFIYESLLEIPNLQIYKGETIAILRSFLKNGNFSEVVTTETPNHLIQAWQAELKPLANVIIYPEQVPVADQTSPRRFARYWRKNERLWLQP